MGVEAGAACVTGSRRESAAAAREGKGRPRGRGQQGLARGGPPRDGRQTGGCQGGPGPGNFAAQPCNGTGDCCLLELCKGAVGARQSNAFTDCPA